MANSSTTNSPIPAVPLRTPMFDGQDFAAVCGNLTRTWIIFFESLLPPSGFQSIDKVTFGLGIGAAQPVGNDLTTHGQCFTDGLLLGAYGNAKTPPSTTALYLDILRSTNQGSTWNSIFKTGGVADANKLVIPATNSARNKQTTFVTSPYSVSVGDWWRIDLLAGSGVDAQNINVVLVWGVPSVAQSVQDIKTL